jgi:hypothetical protein
VQTLGARDVIRSSIKSVKVFIHCTVGGISYKLQVNKASLREQLRETKQAEFSCWTDDEGNLHVS